MLSPVRLDIDPAPTSAAAALFDRAKQQIRLDGTEEDILLESYIRAGIDWAEGAMHRTIYQRAHRWVLRDFPHTLTQEIRLPRGKTQSVTSIQYVRNGATVTLTGPSSGSPAGTDWQEDLRGCAGAVLVPPRGESWPSVDFDHPAPVTISFSAGWAAADVPGEIEAAILFYVCDKFEIRGTYDLNAAGGTSKAREALLSSWRLVRWY